jgi:hypothetical protein
LLTTEPRRSAISTRKHISQFVQRNYNVRSLRLIYRKTFPYTTIIGQMITVQQ